MTEAEILAHMRDSGALLTGHFILSSGLHSDRYLQCALLLSHPRRAALIAGALAERIRKRPEMAGVSLVIAPAMGGLIIGHEVARALDLPFLFTERREGKMGLMRGFSVAPGAAGLMVEDVVTTGKSSRECMDALAAAGGQTALCAAIVDRGGGAGLPCPFVPLLTCHARVWDADSVPDPLRAIPAVRPGSRPGVT